MPYEELLKIVKTMSKGTTRFDVVSFLIFFKGHVDENDYHNIQKLCDESWIEE